MAAAAPRTPAKWPAPRVEAARVHELLRHLGDDEAAVFQNEVDLNLNLDIGCMWMDRAGRRTW